MDYEDMLDYLYRLKTAGVKPGLERIEAAMHALGNPQDRIKTIHVTGTNGKGSVCAMLSSILQKAGYRVGMFTSPHLVDFRERFQINGKMIEKDDLSRIVERIKSEGMPLTFFEFSTAIAFQYFFEQGVDYAIIEVGMGGRWDSTNIISKPVATAITSISMDHMDFLGDTLEQISFEKAGIAKPGVPMFTSVLNEIIIEECMGSPIVLVDNKEDTSLPGDFEKENAGLAAAIARHLGIRESHVKDGLMDTRWPARLEFIEKNVLLDCAHNPDAISRLAEFVSTLEYDKLIIVFGVMKNKNYADMLSRLPMYDRIILTKPEIDRSAEPEMLKDLCRNPEIIGDVPQAIEAARKYAKPNDLVLICGSCYMAGEVLAYTRKLAKHPIMWVQ